MKALSKLVFLRYMAQRAFDFKESAIPFKNLQSNERFTKRILYLHKSCTMSKKSGKSAKKKGAASAAADNDDDDSILQAAMAAAAAEQTTSPVKLAMRPSLATLPYQRDESENFLHPTAEGLLDFSRSHRDEWQEFLHYLQSDLAVERNRGGLLNALEEMKEAASRSAGLFDAVQTFCESFVGKLEAIARRLVAKESLSESMMDDISELVSASLADMTDTAHTTDALQQMLDAASNYEIPDDFRITMAKGVLHVGRRLSIRV